MQNNFYFVQYFVCHIRSFSFSWAKKNLDSPTEFVTSALKNSMNNQWDKIADACGKTIENSLSEDPSKAHFLQMITSFKKVLFLWFDFLKFLSRFHFSFSYTFNVWFLCNMQPVWSRYIGKFTIQKRICLVYCVFFFAIHWE